MKGIGRKLLEAVEAAASAKGYKRLILETGAPLADSIRLYNSMGYVKTLNYGPYADMPESICMGKNLM